MQRVDQLGVRVTFGQLDQIPQDAAHDETATSSFRPPDPQRVERARRRRSLDVRAGEHVGAAVRTHRRQRQPHVDGERRDDGALRMSSFQRFATSVRTPATSIESRRRDQLFSARTSARPALNCAEVTWLPCSGEYDAAS